MATELTPQGKRSTRRSCAANVNSVKRVTSQRKYPIKLRDRQFTYREVCRIRKCIKQFFDFGRTRISIEVCDELRWKQPNGWPKDRACRDVLRKLEQMNLVQLPPRKKSTTIENKKRPKPKLQTRFVYKQVAPSNGITLEFAKGNAAEKSWNALVNENHYLGHRIVVGRCLKYLIKYHDLTVGAIAFSSAAWQVETRDKTLTQLGMSTDKIRESVINNCRFLMLDNARGRNLASQALAASTKQAAHDWEQFYSIRPLIVETFVLPSKFKGTCYKAANWIEIGTTKGYAKCGTNHRNSQEPKRVFLYGLNRRIRKKLMLHRATVQ
jgi:hypothetical protein